MPHQPIIWFNKAKKYCRNLLRHPHTRQLIEYAIFAVLIISFAIASTSIYKIKNAKETASITPLKTNKVTKIAATPTPTLAAEAKQTVTKNPPAKPKKGSSSTRTNSDGSKTTLVSDGNINSGDAGRVSSIPPASSIAAISYRDETGQNAALESILKDYLSNTLKWSNEVGQMREIIVRDAGATGWTGLYSGGYTIAPSGDITSAYGWITLNVYYYKTSPYFNDYMKLTFSHEYGHHYTLYHKWVHWDLPEGTRFPDAYYTIRPLSKATTATDYSLGWSNCEAEIIAEDYSYLYSGYGYHAMSGTYSYPSNPGTKNWLNALPSGPGAPPPANNPPTVSITAPASGATVSGTIAFSADASDDYGVSKVSFYVNDSLSAEDSSSPYSISLNTAAYANNTYTLKAVASDGTQTAQATISVTFNNAVVDEESPVLTITQPAPNPYAWAGTSFPVQASATDNIAATRIEVYVDDELITQQSAASISITLTCNTCTPGTYTLKLKAFDAAGNFDEETVTLNKS